MGTRVVDQPRMYLPTESERTDPSARVRWRKAPKPPKGVPANGAPTEGVPANGAPAEGVPANGAPANSAPANSAPAPAESVPPSPIGGVPKMRKRRTRRPSVRVAVATVFAILVAALLVDPVALAVLDSVVRAIGAVHRSLRLVLAVLGPDDEGDDAHPPPHPPQPMMLGMIGMIGTVEPIGRGLGFGYGRGPGQEGNADPSSDADADFWSMMVSVRRPRIGVDRVLDAAGSITSLAMYLGWIARALLLHRRVRFGF